MKAMIATVKMKYLLSFLLGSSLSACTLLNNSTPGPSPSTVSSQAIHDTFLSCLPEIVALPGGSKERIRLQTLQPCLQTKDIENVEYFLSNSNGAGFFLVAKKLTAPYQVELAWEEGTYSIYSETQLHSGKILRSKNTLVSALNGSEPRSVTQLAQPNLSCVPELVIKAEDEWSYLFDFSTACVSKKEISSVNYYFSTKFGVDQANELGEKIIENEPVLNRLQYSVPRDLRPEFKLNFPRCEDLIGEFYINVEIVLQSGLVLNSNSILINNPAKPGCPRINGITG